MLFRFLYVQTPEWASTLVTYISKKISLLRDLYVPELASIMTTFLRHDTKHVSF